MSFQSGSLAITRIARGVVCLPHNKILLRRVSEVAVNFQRRELCSDRDLIRGSRGNFPGVVFVLEPSRESCCRSGRDRNRADLERILSINALAPVYLTQRLLKKKKVSRGASIVFTVSIGGVYTTAFGNAMYGMSKGALQVFMKNVALECSANGIRCNSVNPGMINTGLLKPGTYSEEDRKKDMLTYPLGRYGEPREVALGIVYLLSDAASFVTGHSLIIDGGKTLY